MSLPKIVIIYEADDHGEKYLIASGSIQDVMQDSDGPRVVGTYRIFNKRTLVKNIKVTKETKA